MSKLSIFFAALVAFSATPIHLSTPANVDCENIAACVCDAKKSETEEDEWDNYCLESASMSVDKFDGCCDEPPTCTEDKKCRFENMKITIARSDDIAENCDSGSQPTVQVRLIEVCTIGGTPQPPKNGFWTTVSIVDPLELTPDDQELSCGDNCVYTIKARHGTTGAGEDVWKVTIECKNCTG